MMFYSIMALSHVVSEILNVEKYRDLEIPVKSQSRSLKVVPFDKQAIVCYQCFILALSLRYSTSEMLWPWDPG